MANTNVLYRPMENAMGRLYTSYARWNKRAQTTKKRSLCTKRGDYLMTLVFAGTCEGAKGNLWCYEPIPDYAFGCTVAKMEIK